MFQLAYAMKKKKKSSLSENEVTWKTTVNLQNILVLKNVQRQTFHVDFQF